MPYNRALDLLIVASRLMRGGQPEAAAKAFARASSSDQLNAAIKLVSNFNDKAQKAEKAAKKVDKSETASFATWPFSTSVKADFEDELGPISVDVLPEEDLEADFLTDFTDMGLETEELSEVIDLDDPEELTGEDTPVDSIPSQPSGVQSSAQSDETKRFMRALNNLHAQRVQAAARKTKA